MMPERHDLVWVRRGWRAAAAGPVPPDAAAWLDRGLPAVAARSAEPGTIALGISLPARRRAAVSVAPGAIARVAAPPPLRAVVPSLPPGWRAPLAALDRRARVAGLAPRVYGSVLWQWVSGETRVGEASDADVIVDVRTQAALDAALRLLASHRGAPRLDGEIVLPGGRAVAWRELADGAARVLVKWRGGVEVVDRAAIVEALA